MRYVDAIFLGKKVRCDFDYDAIAIPDFGTYQFCTKLNMHFGLRQFDVLLNMHFGRCVFDYLGTYAFSTANLTI